MATRDAERLVLFSWHGDYEDLVNINERILTGTLKTLAGARGPGGFELIGHYVVIDAFLGILYLEPEVYILSEAERRDPSRLRETLMRPPYQLLFERGPAASSHTRLLTLSVIAGASAHSNYVDKALLTRMRADSEAERRSGVAGRRSGAA